MAKRKPKKGDPGTKVITRGDKEYVYAVETFYFKGRQYEVTAPTREKAIAKAALKERALENGDIGINSKMTVKRWAEEWLETYKKPTVLEKSYKDYKRQIDNFIVPEIGNLRLTEVNDIHLQKILNARAGLSLTRVKLLKITICAIFSKACATKLINHDPSAYLEMPKAKNGTHRSITDFERQHFLKVAETHPAGLMFKMMLYCGLRTGEVTALSWKDIDFGERLVRVEAAMESGKDTIKDTKTMSGNRSIPIPDVIYEDLLKAKGDPFSPVFTQPTSNNPHTESSRQRAWDSMRRHMDRSMGAVFDKRKAKDGKMRMTKVLSVITPDFVPYCLRHTYCTDLQAKGVDIKTASYLMGHANISVTANIYTHITEQTIKDVADKINGNNNRKQIDAS